MSDIGIPFAHWNRFPRDVSIAPYGIPPKLAEALKSWRELHRIWPLGDYADKACSLATAIDAEPLLKPKP